MLMMMPFTGVASRSSIRSFAMVTAAPPAARVAPVIVQEAHGFKLERQQFVKEYDSEVLFYRHQKTGAGSDNPENTSTFSSRLACPATQEQMGIARNPFDHCSRSLASILSRASASECHQAKSCAEARSHTDGVRCRRQCCDPFHGTLLWRGSVSWHLPASG